MRGFFAGALACLGLGMGLRAYAQGRPNSNGSPIPPETWAIRDPASHEGPGAIILAKTVRLTDTQAIYAYRVRIFSERGIAAAEFKSFPAGTSGLEGRVAYPDGSEMRFSSEKDFHARTLLASRFLDVKTTVLVPPGLTDNCVVDLSAGIPTPGMPSPGSRCASRTRPWPRPCRLKAGEPWPAGTRPSLRPGW